jgi:ABC-type uncharacterized transport system permease subunit
MNDTELVRILSSIVLQSTPLIIAVCGETISERVGVVNLSLDGTMLLSAMTGFVAGLLSGNVWIGFLAAALVGAFFAWIIAFGSIRLRKDQFAVGFVLTLLGDELSAFLGQNYTRIPGESVHHLGIPILKDIPILGPIFFDHDPLVYFAFLLIGVTWWWLFRTQPGLRLRSAGERPESGFARGVDVNRLRYVYTLIGGGLVGIAGAAYSLDIKLGWSEGHTRGLGWIALAIVIFGGWSPLRGAVGSLLMITVLLLVGSDVTERLVLIMPRRVQPRLRRLLRVRPPAALGVAFSTSETQGE